MEFYEERKYYLTLKMIFIKAVKDLYPKAEVIIQNALNKGIYIEVIKKPNLTGKDVEKIRERMDEIIGADYFINETCADVETLKKMSDSLKRPDITRLLDNSGWIDLREYELNGYHDYFHGKLYSKTGVIYLYSIEQYKSGIILKYPLKSNPKELPEAINTPKLAKVFEESAKWHEIMDVLYVGGLNEQVINSKIEDLIRINETLHHIKLSKIAEKIANHSEIKIVTIAGPSASGKTTFGKRLCLHLKANQILPVIISADDYYKNRNSVPSDCNGKKDYENIESLDLKLINKHLEELAAGKEVEIPSYNFLTGEREKEGVKIKVPDNGIIIIEGIHGLNEKLTEAIPKEHKFKIYISCLTQLNIDMHNRVSTTDVRKIRRIVRDSLARGASAEETLGMWESVKKGEEKYIFPYQEEADAMFDSNLVYELGVLKIFAVRELIKIKVTSPYYEEAKRLIKFLDYFMDIDEKFVPDDSLLKEFIGGSYFYKY